MAINGNGDKKTKSTTTKFAHIKVTRNTVIQASECNRVRILNYNNNVEERYTKAVHWILHIHARNDANERR